MIQQVWDQNSKKLFLIYDTQTLEKMHFTHVSQPLSPLGSVPDLLNHLK